jgi:ribonuclease P protein component
VRWYDPLRRSSEIAFVRRRGRQAGFSTLAAFAAEGKGRRPRVGITVSGQVGGAVVRNRIRRRIRGALDALPPVRQALRLLFIARPSAAHEPYAKLAADVDAALARLAAGTPR